MDISKELEKYKEKTETPEVQRDRDLLRAVLKGRMYATALLLMGEQLLEIGLNIGGEEETNEAVERSLALVAKLVEEGQSPTAVASIAGGMCLALATVAFTRDPQPRKDLH